ncbi:TetR/AcrR family transcriptional regulator [Saccharospirillum sp.]|uniref:TetR/AcrR family transcriptional regulator n=1 Tax=Saccharospirillum sp. TaxID=2033801 RepID=UPI0034A096D6
MQTPSSEKDTGAYDRLLEAGRHLFLHQEYQRVSIRRIAERAGVNSAMIAYYFGDKSGLYRAVLLSYLGPVKSHVLENLKQFPATSFVDVFKYFYRFAPRELIHLVIKNALYAPDAQRQWLIDSVLRPLILQVEQQLDQTLPDGKIHRPEQARLMLQSLLVAPLLLQPILEAVRQKPMDDDYFDDLADFIGTLLDRALRPSEGDPAT